MTEKTFDEEVMEVINDTELPNQDWIKKYGDKFYWRVIREIVLQRIDSCRTPWVGIDGTIEDVKFINIADLHRAFNIEEKEK
jgi:hypothetical protein